MSAFEIADALRACLETAYEGDTGIPAEICHRPGAEVPLNFGMAQDECCTGLGWVRIASVDPVIDPQESEQPSYNPCDSSRSRLTIELGVARCNPTGTAAAGPTCDQWTELAARMDLDRIRMRQAVCCLAGSSAVLDEQYVYRVLPGSWIPLDSSGGCAGGTMTVIIYTDCGDCS